MPFVLLSLSAVGLALLIFCIYMLVSSFVGWKYRYDASIAQAAVDIPKAGRYSISISRDRFWLWKGHGNLSNALPKVGFTITKPGTGEAIRYFPALSLFTSTGVGKVTIPVGYFDAASAGEYLITSQPESKFLQSEEIMIRKYASTARKVLSIVGIVISANMFLGGLIVGILLLTGNWHSF